MNNVIIFDYDGVIVDSLDIFMDNFIFACIKEGWNKIKSKKDFLKLFDGNMYENMYNLGLTKEKIKKIIISLRHDLLKNQDKIKYFEGIINVIEKLSSYNILFIVTSNDNIVIENFFKIYNIKYFKDIIGSDKGFSKTQKIKNIKSNYPNHNVYYICDTIGDIKEGKNAGIFTVAVTWGWHNKNKLLRENPTYLVENPGDLEFIFN
jgi:phosphoglycolate phosphatase